MERDKKSESPERPEPRSTRREILRGGLLIAGAAAVARVSTGGTKEARAADGQPLILGQPNTAASRTSLTSPPGVAGGFYVDAQQLDPNQPGTIDIDLNSALRGTGFTVAGVEGRSLVGVGVLGQAGNLFVNDPNTVETVGVYGASIDAVGVLGRSLVNYGIIGQTGTPFGEDPNQVFPIAGVIGFGGSTGDPNDANFYAGVVGVAGSSTDPNSPVTFAGIAGFAQDPNNPAVFAQNALSAGLALNVQGRALFSTAGTGKIPAKIDRVPIAHVAVTATSIVLVTLSSDPIGGKRLKYVEVSDGTFTVVLSGKAKVDVNFGYLILN